MSSYIVVKPNNVSKRGSRRSRYLKKYKRVRSRAKQALCVWLSKYGGGAATATARACKYTNKMNII